MVSSGNDRGGGARANRGAPRSWVRTCTEICGEAVGAGHNAAGADLCDDPGVCPAVLIVDDHVLVLATMRLGGALCEDRGVRPTVLIVDDHDGFRESAR